MTRFWARGVAKILKIDIQVNKSFDSERRGIFVISNHQSYLDVIIHASILPLRFTPKREVFYWPVLGQLAALSRPIWIRRQSKTSSIKNQKDFLETFECGASLIVYPEGTTSDGKNGLLPFKSSVFEAAIQANIPIVPVITTYPGMNIEDVGWYGDMTFAPHLWNLIGLDKIRARVDFLPSVEPIGKERKVLAKELHSMMQEEFLKIKKI